jgi:hypothetical protein
MLSKDELAEGVNFVLKPHGEGGAPVCWMEKLRGVVARHWFEICRRSDWAPLIAEASGVFRSPVSTDLAERTFRKLRCVVIQPQRLTSADLN